MMKTLLNILLLFFYLEAYATEQKPDILFYEGNKYELYTSHSITSPLETFEQVSEELAMSGQTWSSGCWRRYTAEWVIENGQLYLANVRKCEDGKVVNNLVEKVINRKFVDGKIKADWVSGTYWGGRGERHWSAFDNEIKFYFQDGALVNKKQYVSPNCSLNKHESLNRFIYSKINWGGLPDKVEQVSIDFKTDSQGKLVQAEVRHSKNSEFEKEALRVLRLVPCWQVFTYTGEVFGWQDIDIIFSEENKKKYTN